MTLNNQSSFCPNVGGHTILEETVFSSARETVVETLCLVFLVMFVFLCVFVY